MFDNKSGNQFKGNITGNNNTTVNGDLNIENISYEKNIPTQTEMFGLLEIVNDLNLKNDNKFPLRMPTELNKKLKYNNAIKYRVIFEEITVYTDQFEYVMSQFLNSQSIISKLSFLFLDVADKDRVKKIIVVGDGDEQLDKIKNELIKQIKNDPRFQKSNFTEEKLCIFIYLLLSYGVSKCKVLLQPD